MVHGFYLMGGRVGRGEGVPVTESAEGMREAIRLACEASIANFPKRREIREKTT